MRRRNAQQEEALASLRRTLHTRDEFLAMASHELRTPITTLGLQTEGLLHLGGARRQRQWPPGRSGRRAAAETPRLDPKSGAAPRPARRPAARRLAPDRGATGAPAGGGGPRGAWRAMPSICCGSRRSARGRRSSCARGPASWGAGIAFASGRWSPTCCRTRSSSVAASPSRSRWKPRPTTTAPALQVKDAGEGIPPEEQTRIFERFERVTTGPATRASGLGLWISKQIVEASRGTISVESRSGQGSTFTVRLPRAG